MRQLAVAGLFLTAMAGGVFAADLRPPVKAPVAPPAAYVVMNWTGFYLGAQAGYSWGKDDVCQYFNGVLAVDGCRDLGANSFVGGVHAGYNLQFGQIVLGVEADVEAARRHEFCVPGWRQRL